MKFFAVAASLALTVHTHTWVVWYDTHYDEREASLSTVACSTGEFGLQSYGYKVFGDIPTFPNIGGAPDIQSWGSEFCGACWELTYTDPFGDTWSINFTAINIGGGSDGFTMSLSALNTLTNGNGLTFDGVSVALTTSSAPADRCNL